MRHKGSQLRTVAWHPVRQRLIARRGRPEALEQEAVVLWLRCRRLLFCHPANGGLRSPRTGAMLKRAGVVPGTPDLLIFSPPPALAGRVGFALEMKAIGGAKTARGAQKAWLEGLAKAGWAVAVCRGAQEALDALRRAGY